MTLLRKPGPRFVIEAIFIVLTAWLTLQTQARWWAIIGFVIGAWILCALFELAVSQVGTPERARALSERKRRRPARVGTSKPPVAAVTLAPDPAATAQRASRPATPEPLAASEPALEPASEPVSVPEPAFETEPELEPAAALVSADVPVDQGELEPAFAGAAPDLRPDPDREDAAEPGVPAEPQLQPEPEPEPEPVMATESEAAWPASDEDRPLPVDPPAPEPVAPEPVATDPVATDPVATEPEPLPAWPLPDLEAEPEPEPESVADPEPVAEPEPVFASARQWNIWNLDQLVREQAGDNEELTFLLMYLREYANADGMLPADFDGLVRESFGDLILAETR